MLKTLLKYEYGINDELINLSLEIEDQIKEKLKEIDNIKEYNQIKVLSAMQKMGLADRHLNGTTGYGYNDIGRDIIDEIYAEVFKTEDAMVRSQIVSGTHALATCLFGILRPGDTMLSCAGKPYDTLESVIGIKPNPGSLVDFGVKYEQVDLLPDDEPDLEKIYEAVNENTKLALIQRSRGYSYRKALSIESIGKIIKTVKSKNKNTVCMVDNCYGEFVCTREPSEVGADIIAGSLIKNPGGGLALNGGGYVAGKAHLVEMCANRLTSPGLGKRVGASLGATRNIIQGFFLAPHVVSECSKGAVFMAALFERLGFDTSPSWDYKRSDIVQAIKFNDPDKLIKYCEAIQKAAPVDSFVTPVPGDMPGYTHQVIMAAGAFVQGASIELSADGPIKEPYIAYMQGGLMYEHVKLAAILAAKSVLN